ncbi:MAG: diacylglycerol kinase family lipid kinase [Bacilli bacterium]|nr:diacylglycerol kinase family lipid kinase [Bacilli bacterium]
MKKCVMIYNSKSGRKKSNNLLSQFEKIINDRDYSFEVKYTKRKNHAMRIVKELPDDIDLVIAAGGDGTFNEVISGNLKRDKKLLIANLPLGTTNDVATMYGYQDDYIENLKILLDGEIKNIDICKINNKAFVYFAGIGSFVNVTYETPRRLKEKYGRTAYIIYALRQFTGRLKTYNIKYEIDGKKYGGNYSFIFITNSSSVAGVNDIYPDVKLDDNKFEVLLCDIKSKMSLLKSLSMLKKKDIRTIPNLQYYKTDNIKIIFDNVPNESWCLDGEEMKHNQRSFNFYISKEINVLVPKVNIDKLFV